MNVHCDLHNHWHYSGGTCRFCAKVEPVETATVVMDREVFGFEGDAAKAINMLQVKGRALRNGKPEALVISLATSSDVTISRECAWDAFENSKESKYREELRAALEKAQ
jgi:hypothetical protein